MKRDDLKMYLALAAVAGLSIWWLRNTLTGAANGVTGAVSDAWNAASDGPGVRSAIGNFGGYVGNVAAGAVEGIGMVVGVPRTNTSQCQRDLSAGSYWDASFSCPATDFLSGAAAGVWGSTTVQQATQADVRRVDNAIGRPAGADVFYTPYGGYGGI